MADIFLVRHGQDEDNAAGILNGHRDRPLTELGREQAAAVAGKLADEDIAVVYTSPLKRANQTGEIIAARLGIPVKVEPLLIERDFGVMTGKPVADILELPNILKTDKVNYFLDVEGCEPFPEVYERARTVLGKLQEENPDRHIAVATHGDIGKMIRAVYHGWSWKQGLEQPYLDNTGVLELRADGDRVE
jgi:probable phosphoglycerate mutase